MRRARKLLIVFSCWSIVCAAGCAGELTPEAKKLLADGKLAYERGDDGVAVANMDLFLKDHARSKRADEAYYYRGLAKYRMRELVEAKADFRQALERSRSKAVSVGARVALGDLAYDTNDHTTAEQMYTKLLDMVDADKKPADHVYYRLGCTLQRQGRWDQADQYFDKVIYLFDGTELARRSLLHARCKAWTIQAGAFSARSRAAAAAAELKRNNLPASERPALRDERLVFLGRPCATKGSFFS
ncbi:MAG: tetratricopeptide repeat protein [Planctomycetota bacterium]|jgi:outer membrane protein assembly factor BamD (BamD/ComL family)